jgi:hypothetical protein
VTHHLLAILIGVSLLLGFASETVHAFAPRGYRRLANAVSAWLLAFWLIIGALYLLTWLAGVRL